MTPHKLSTDFYKHTMTCVINKNVSAFKKYFFILLVPMFYLCIWKCTMYMQYPQSLEKGVKALRTRITDGHKQLCWCWKWTGVICKNSKWVTAEFISLLSCVSKTQNCYISHLWRSTLLISILRILRKGDCMNLRAAQDMYWVLSNLGLYSNTPSLIN